jgi:uncharacterized protein (DUF885 family)
VAPVPDYLAPTYTAGRYSGGGGGTRAGEYWVNTYNLPSRTLYTLEALTLHEAVPGHHLQISLAQELSTWGMKWGFIRIPIASLAGLPMKCGVPAAL